MPRRTITETRARFQAIEADRAARATARTEKLVQRILQRMIDGEPFDVDDFMFAATAGKPEKQEKEAAILKTASRLALGETVGLAQDGKLYAVGLASNTPLRMSVEEGKPWYIGAQMTASLDLYFAAERRARPHCGDTVHVPKGNQGRLTAVLLQKDPEHDPRPAYERNEQIFHPRRELLIGADDLMQYVDTEKDTYDRPSAQLVAAHVQQITEAVVNPARAQE